MESIMNRTAALSLALFALAAAASAGESRTIEGNASLGPDQEVRLDFPVGELEITGVEGDAWRIEVVGRCKRATSRCAEILQEISIEIRERGSALAVEVAPQSEWRSWDSLQIEARVTHPADRPLRVDMSVGELSIEGLRGDLEVDLGVGEVSVDLPVGAVKSVSLDAGIGETELLVPDGWVEGERSFLVGSECSWREGLGKARIHVEVGVGEAVVRLED
jgi:hypothetical protein